MNRYSYLFKYIIIGDPSVGKSCLLMQFLENKFKADSQTTVGVEFGSKNIDLNKHKIKLQIWDTAGQQIFRSITRSYYRGSIGAVLVYDITNKSSFKNIEKWLEDTKSYANQKISLILVGTKNDLQSEREVSYDEGKRFAELNSMLFLECSAKNYELTEAIFFKLAEQILSKIEKKIVDPKNENLGVKLGTYQRQNEQIGQKHPKRNCC